jgi:glucose-1-phosphate cytidylyltransferase
MDSLKTVILAGGLGTRLAEYTETIPKPMVTIAGKPILWHVLSTYAQYDYKDFVIALGYKGEKIKEYFVNYETLSSDFTIDLSTGKVESKTSNSVDWHVTLVDTGPETMTGGRIKRLKDYLGENTFLLTYGDGLTNVNVAELVEFHKSHGKMVTVTAVHPGARFGELEIDGSLVKRFEEKPQTKSGWINGGYFVFEPEFLDYIKNDHTILEKEPLEKVAKLGQLCAFMHDGFWHCMDTKRDRDSLEELAKNGVPPWLS